MNKNGPTTSNEQDESDTSTITLTTTDPSTIQSSADITTIEPNPTTPIPSPSQNIYYSLRKTKCLPCVKGCVNCSGPSIDDCSACLNGFTFDQMLNECVACSNGCAKCSSIGKCTECRDGFVRDKNAGNCNSIVNENGIPHSNGTTPINRNDRNSQLIIAIPICICIAVIIIVLTAFIISQRKRVYKSSLPEMKYVEILSSDSENELENTLYDENSSTSQLDGLDSHDLFKLPVTKLIGKNKDYKLLKNTDDM